MTTHAVQPAALWPALATTAAIAGFAYLFLRVEAQWEVVALTAGALVALLALGRTRLGAAVGAAWSVRPAPLAWGALLATSVVVALFAEDHFALLMIATVLLYGVACLGLTIQFGYAGVVNFSGAAFFGIGGYTAAVLATHTALPHLLVVAAGGVLAGAIGSLLVLPLLRTRGHYAALITIAFAILFKTFLEVNDALGGPQGLKVPGLRMLGWSFNDNIALGEYTELSFYLDYAVFSLLLLAGALLLVRRLERSWLGLSLDAVRIDETAASVFGFEVARWKILAFTLGNVLAGTAGAVYAMMTGFVAPASFTLAESLILVSIVILGGLGNPVGVLAAAALVVMLPEKLQVIQEYRFLLFSAFVILVLLFRPEGLLPRKLRQYLPGWGRA
ncbi:MAG TPA: branched-chain amino acid ABC transporter permease [Burkholderiales bacterium]|nr:branched-chain amino acid ABC transporter permease [Burkholderiales bacterium]